jgi:dTDP-4-amino-4,6-dideoxygalactose transaminase
MTRETQVPVPLEGGVPMAELWFGDEEAEAVAAVVRSGWVSQGEQVVRFEKAVAGLVGAPHAVAVSNCTAALHLGIVAFGVGPGDEVVVPSLSMVATANAPRYVGARPVFAEVDPTTHNVTAETVEEALTSRTRAVIAVDQCGLPADIAPIKRLCDERGIALVQDAACSLGSSYRGGPAGTDAEFAAFSFHARKILVTGEGGMITSNREDIARRVRHLRQHGMSASSYERHLSNRTVLEEYVETGFNFRMTDMQAALGVVQAAKVPAMVARRRELAAKYHALLSGIDGLQLVQDPSYSRTNYQTFWAVLPDDFRCSRNDLLDELKRHGVSARRGVTAAHLERAFADIDSAVDLSGTDRITHQSLLLPKFHELTEAQQARVADVLHASARGTSILT